MRVSERTSNRPIAIDFAGCSALRAKRVGRLDEIESLERSARSETCTEPGLAGGRSHQSRVALRSITFDKGPKRGAVTDGNWLARVETGEVVERAFVVMNICLSNGRSLSRNFPNRCLPFCLRAGMFIPPNSRSTPDGIVNLPSFLHTKRV